MTVEDTNVPDGTDTSGQGDDQNAGNGVDDQNVNDQSTSDQGGADAGNGDPAAGSTDPGEQIAPEQYSDFEIPEGMEMNQSLLDIVDPIFKKANMTQAQAQEVISAYSELEKGRAQEQFDNLTTQINEWETAAKYDKEYGGDKFEESVGIAKKGMDAYFSDEVKTLLIDSGLGSHPEIIRGFLKIGQTIKEDDPSSSTGKVDSNTDRISRLYPNN